MKIKGKRYVGPSRPSRDLAVADLAEIRAAANKNDAIRVVRRLKGSCVKVGGVQANANGWRAGMSIKNRRYFAPTRETRDLAEADLAEIRAAANKDESIRVVRRLKESCVKSAEFIGGLE